MVVGGGVLGLAVALDLQDRGRSVLVLERGVVGGRQSAGECRGFRHLHADPWKIELAVRAREAWDAWSARAGEVLLGGEGARRRGGDIEGDAARLRSHGVDAAVEGDVMVDRRGGAIRARRTVEWLASQVRVRHGDVTSARPGGVVVGGAESSSSGLVVGGEIVPCGHVVLCTAAAPPLVDWAPAMRRVPHVRLTFAGDAGIAGAWADRSGPVPVYGVSEGTDRFALGPAEEVSDPRAAVVAYARQAFPGLREVVGEVRADLTIFDGPDEDRFVVETRDGVTVVAGHNLFKFAPVIGAMVSP